MSWAEIKKAINDDISKPLSVRIVEWFTGLKEYISTGGSVKIVRHVQRGFVKVSGYAYDYEPSGSLANVTLSGFTDTSKMLVILNGGVYYVGESKGDSLYVTGSAFVKSLSTTQLSLSNTSGFDSLQMSSGGYVSYEVIEFY